MPELQITVLANNTAGWRGLLAEHGLSFWIEAGKRKILFDTGQGLVLRHNARRLGIRLNSADGIVLSHGHYDHTGGLLEVLEHTQSVPVFTHPAALEPKYARDPGGNGRDIGMEEPIRQILRAKADLRWIEKPTPISEGIWCTGPVPRTNDFEDTGGAFFKDADCLQPDEIQDDQAIFAETESGTVVVLGCAHAGIVNTVRYIRTLTDDRPIRALLGGMHLLNAGPQRLESTVDELRRLKIERLMPCHCTGFSAMARIWNEFPDRCEAVPTGSMIRF